MNTIMAKSSHDSSFSFSRRYLNFHFKNPRLPLDEEDHDQEERILNLNPSSHFSDEPQNLTIHIPKKTHSVSVSKFKSALTLFTKSPSSSALLGSRVVGTLFGHRRGRVHIAFQEDPKSHPPFLIELPTPTSVLVREMASGLVRIALECEKKKNNKNKSESTKSRVKLVEEPVWRSYCNGRKCGYANRVECGGEEWEILKAVAPISMGAGVLPASENGSEGEVMYMRARFERVVGSKDSEAYYLMSPDGSGGPELSIYLLRV